MKTMQKAGKFVLGAAIPLLVLAIVAGPTTAATVEYRMWVEPIGTAGTNGAAIPAGAYTADALKTLAPGTYQIEVQARVLGNRTTNAFKSGTTWYHGYPGLSQWSFALIDSSGIGDPLEDWGDGVSYNDTSALRFTPAGDVDAGFRNYWGSVLGAKATAYAPTMGKINMTQVSGLDAGTKMEVATMGGSYSVTSVGAGGAAGTSSVGNYGGFRVPTIGNLQTGAAGAAPSDDSRWFSLVTGNFEYVGGRADLSMKLIEGTAATAISDYTTAWVKTNIANTQVTVAPTLAFGTDGGPVLPENRYSPVATTALNNNGQVSNPASWHHGAAGGWWMNDPTAYITLDGSAAQTGDTIKTWEWVLTVGGQDYPIWSHEAITNVTVDQLSKLGIGAPPRLEDNGGAWTYATLKLSVYDGTGDSAAGVSTFNFGNSTSSQNLVLPEPASMVVLALGAVATLLRRRRRA